MSEELLGYLLGALEPEEAAVIAARLQVDVELRRELEELRSLLEPLTADRQYLDPPEGLSDRVSEAVRGLGRRKGTLPQGTPAATTGFSWRRIDAATIAGVTLTTFVLLVPVIASNRYQAQTIACRQRLHTVGQALVDYSRLHGGLFPEVPVNGNLARAGIYAVHLQQAGHLTDERNVYCPAVAVGDAGPAFVPELSILQTADSTAAASLFEQMNGAFGYAMGYVNDGRYHALRNHDRAHFAVLADSPAEHGGGGRNHGCGQNVWFEDGHAEFLNACRVGARDDALYENHDGFVGAGIGPDDVVIGAAAAQPRLVPVSLEE